MLVIAITNVHVGDRYHQHLIFPIRQKSMLVIAITNMHVVVSRNFDAQDSLRVVWGQILRQAVLA